MLRIIAGEHRGRILKTVSGNHTRPTSDRVKESLFNVIQSRLSGSAVLDLFAGTGNLGLEALSRGGSRAVFVEKDAKASSVLKDNISSLKYDDRSKVMTRDVIKAIEELKAAKQSFDIIFMDPPYNKNLEIPVIEYINTNNMLNDNGLIVVEHLLSDLQPDSVAGFLRYDLRKYGSTGISIYRKGDSDEDSGVSRQL